VGESVELAFSEQTFTNRKRTSGIKYEKHNKIPIEVGGGENDKKKIRHNSQQQQASKSTREKLRHARLLRRMNFNFRLSPRVAKEKSSPQFRLNLSMMMEVFSSWVEGKFEGEEDEETSGEAFKAKSIAR
jgi:hypothetical protein